MTPKTLDHVAFWVEGRDAIADFLTRHVGMHVIDRTDRFTLVGSDARHGKLTLFDADGPREPGAFKHVALRVSDLEAARAELPDGSGDDELELAEGVRVRLVEAPTDVEYDLDHVALVSPDPERTAAEYVQLGFNATEPADGVPRVEVGGAFVEFHHGEPGDPERPLLNHVAVLVDSAEEHIAGRGTSASRSTTSSTRRTRMRSSCGGRSTSASSTSSTSRLSASPRRVLTIAGAGMAGLCAAAHARERGAEPVVLEKGTRPGGSMLLSSCVIWRFRTLDDFRTECPGGDERLQAAIVERLDDALEWLESLGAPVVARETGNPRTVGMRFEPGGLTEALVRAAGDVRLEHALPGDVDGDVVLATGGFGVRLARERGLLVRSNAWSEGDGLEWATERGANVVGPLDEFYGRVMPAPPARITERDFVPLAQLYGRFARIVDERGEEFFPGPPSWSENDLVQAIARRPGGRAWFEVDPEALAHPDVGPRVEAARRAGGTVVERDGRIAVHVAAAVTHTIGGLRIDERARVLDAGGTPIAGLYAAGADAGGISTGGYASGLAAALVFGRIAAEEALEP